MCMSLIEHPAAVKERRESLALGGRGGSLDLLQCVIFWKIKYARNNSKIILKERDARLNQALENAENSVDYEGTLSEECLTFLWTIGSFDNLAKPMASYFL